MSRRRKKSSPIKRSRPVVRRPESTRAPAGGGAPADRPAWAPAGADFDDVPEAVRRNAVELIEPVYQRLVVGTEDPLERTVGLTLVHLMWVEILDQHEPRREYHTKSNPDVPRDYARTIDRQLRTLNTKIKVGNFLTRLREIRRREEAAGPKKLTVDSSQLSVPRSRGGDARCQVSGVRCQESADATGSATAENTEAATQKTGERLGQILALAEKYKREAKKTNAATPKVASESLESRL